LFVHARDLFIAAMVDRSSSYPPSNIGGLVSKSHGIALIMLNSRISCIIWRWTKAVGAAQRRTAPQLLPSRIVP
jgi:hypothetical protein